MSDKADIAKVLLEAMLDCGHVNIVSGCERCNALLDIFIETLITVCEKSQ